MSLNKQGPGKIEWCDYSWNVIDGCLHGCQWQMPDGSTIQCYAKTLADRFRSPQFMPNGFEQHYFHSDRLKDPFKLKRPAKIFLDSFSDLMGHWVPDEQIEAVLDVCRQTPHHTYQLLTKNAPRLLKFEFPENAWIGCSVPPSAMFGKPLSEDQQRAMFVRTLDVLREVNARVKWISFEPLSWDVSNLMILMEPRLQWAVIGAATNGKKVYQPDPVWVRNLIEVLEWQDTAIFFKGNLKGNEAAEPWYEQFPNQ